MSKGVNPNKEVSFEPYFVRLLRTDLRRGVIINSFPQAIDQFSTGVVTLFWIEVEGATKARLPGNLGRCHYRLLFIDSVKICLCRSIGETSRLATQEDSE